MREVIVSIESRSAAQVKTDSPLNAQALDTLRSCQIEEIVTDNLAAQI